MLPEIKSLRSSIHPSLGRGRRAIALMLAGLVVFAGLAALRHEASVAHARGALTGELEHTHALADFHQLSTTAHLHSRTVTSHVDGACSLLAALDHSTILPGAPLTASGTQPITVTSVLSLPFETPARALYRLAPKTSPPAIV